MIPPREETTRPPLLFISHKHADREIATVLRKFVERTTWRQVKVFQSSSSEAASPQLGRPLTAELKKALWDTSALVLVYTTEDQDWSWCMWECGVATRADSPETRTIVIQCSNKEPTVFADQVRCNARSRDDVAKFVRTFLTDPEFFPGYGGAFAPDLSPTGDEVRTAADDLFEELQHHLPSETVVERFTFPNLQLEMSQDDLRELTDAKADRAASLKKVPEKARVAVLDQRVQQIFGIAGLVAEQTLAALAARWSAYRPRGAQDWLDDICLQVLRAAAGEMPELQWNCVVEVNGGQLYVPVLSRVRPLSAARRVQFDIQLLPYDELAATSVAARMIPLSEMQVVDLGAQSPEEITLLEIAQTFDQKKLSRIPFVDPQHRVRYIVHRSMIDRYLVAAAGKGADIKLATFGQLLRESPELKQLFESSFVTVDRDARLAEAQAAMIAKPDCQDVFVTQDGSRDLPVLGWLTNVTIAQSRSAHGR